MYKTCHLTLIVCTVKAMLTFLPHKQTAVFFFFFGIKQTISRRVKQNCAHTIGQDLYDANAYA